MPNTNFAMSQQLGWALRSRNLSLALAESCTGGGISEEITAVDGASVWFDRGFVTYTNESKHELLGVPNDILKQFGAVSAEVAREMAKGAITNSHADIALSVTGIAGPTGGSPQKPVGLVWFGYAERRTRRCESRMAFFTGGRKNVRVHSVEFGLHWLLENLDVAAGL